MNTAKIFKQLSIDGEKYKDLHILRYFSSYVAVSGGKVIGLTEPWIKYCPLAGYLYREVKLSGKYGAEIVKNAIKKAVEQKIVQFGHFTKRRRIYGSDIAVPYGASEMLMYAMKKGIVDAAVVVCDGAGTVIVNKPGIVQGIGARMNGLFYTSAIPEVVKRLKDAGCHIVFDNASINQTKGVEKAAELGYKRIAVTVNASMNEDTAAIKQMENAKNISVFTLIVCTTGIDKRKAGKLAGCSDMVWSCASGPVRKIIGKKAILQLSKAIPVFVLTRKGLDIAAGYSSNKKLFSRLDLKKQYIVSSEKRSAAGEQIKMGNFEGYLSMAKLPVRSNKEPG